MKRWGYPVGLTLLAAFLRWHDLAEARLLWDHSYSIAEAQRLLLFGEFPLIGQKSTLFLSNPPGQTYLTFIPWVLFGSTWLVFWFFTSLNLIAVPMLYRFVRRFNGAQTGLIAAFLYGLSPWVNHYSRMTWANALVPAMTVWVLCLALSALSNAKSRRRAWYAFAMLGGITIIGQAYLFELIMMPTQVGMILLSRFKRIPWRGIIYGGTVLAVATSLYGATLVRTWNEQGNRFATFTQAGSEPSFKLLATQLAIRYITGKDYYLANTLDDNLPTPLGSVETGLHWGLGLMLVIGLARAGHQIFNRTTTAWIDLTLLIWWVIPIAALSYNNQPLHPWHIIPSLPAGHWLTARGLDWLINKTPRFKRLWQSLGIVVAVFWLSVVNSVNQFNAAHPVALSFDEMTLRTGLQMGATLRDLTTRYQTNEVYVNLHTVVPSALAGKPLESISWFSEKDLLIVPQERPAIYVRLGQGQVRAPFALASRIQILNLPNNEFITFDVFSPLTREQMANLPQTKVEWPSETGLTLLGYTLPEDFQPGKTTTLMTYWFVDELTETRGQYIFAPYLHFNSPDGQIKINVGAPGLPGYHYRLGDLFIQPITVTLPTTAPVGNYYFELGLYDGLHTQSTTFFPVAETPRPFYHTTFTVR